VIYLVGAVTAFLAVVLSLSDAQAGLHSSALAVGLVVAGLATDHLDHRFGARAVHAAALVALASGCALIATAPAFAATLAGTGVCGLGAGILLGHAARTVSAGGGAPARARLARATLVAMVSSVTVPLVIALGEATGAGWPFVAVPALVLVGLALLVTRGRSDPPAPVIAREGRLGLRYWLPWSLVVLVVSAEFAIVFWSGTLIEQRAGVSLATATSTISAFVAGAIVGRIGLSLGWVSRRDPVLLLRAGIVLALACSLLPWLSTVFEMSAVGMFLGGIGLGILYPLAAASALAAAPDQPEAASARLILASGAAILVAPFVLGVAADLADVITGWLLVPITYVAALALTVPVARYARPSPQHADPT
jgi:fucose permease